MSNEAAQILDQSTDAATPNTQTQSPPAATPAAVPPAEPQANNVSPKLEIIIKREQQLRQQAEALKAKESEIQSALERIKEFESAKGNSKKALELLGLNYDELTQSLLKDGEIPPEVEVKKLRDEFSELKKSQEEQREREKQQQLEEAQRHAKLQEEKVTAEFKSEISTYLKDNATRYELTLFEGAEDLVYEVIDEHYQRTLDPETGIGKVMAIPEAADKVEAHYEKREQDKKKLSKVQAFWKVMPPGLARELTSRESLKSQPPKTLTNNLSATPQTRPRPVSEEQRIKGIIAQFKASKGL